MSIANPEQTLAIQHNGGVLLSAGAGSGKTFVLIQHMLFLAEQELSRTRGQNYELRLMEIKKFFSSVVLMTFTKKATGELKIRLRKIINEIDKDAEEKKLLGEGFSMIHVSTIHGFCSTLISLGYINDISSTMKVISETEYQEKMEMLFQRWLMLVTNQEHLLTQWQRNILFLNTKEIKKSLAAVFATPELRVKWENCDINAAIDYASFLNNYLSMVNIENPRQAIEKLMIPPEPAYQKQKWYECVIQFKQIADGDSFEDINSLRQYYEFFNGLKQLRGPAESLGLSSVNDFFAWLKEFRDVLRGGLFESFSAYEEHKDGAYREWQDLFYKAFCFITKNYNSIPGLTFSDLEYFVARGLKEVETRRIVGNHFKYFVVDEFQDTSAIQYEIIKSCINDDLNKLFCVGDVKQAIYGFRGGELGVFNDCSTQIPLKLSLVNNYRSKPAIVQFNNLFFENLFQKGLGYEGHDIQSVAVEKQSFPGNVSTSPQGLIRRLKITLQSSLEKWKPSSDEISKFEAMGLYKLIEEIKIDSSGLICVLYKNLKPSKELISILIQNNIPFRAQIKLSVNEEPIISLFGFCLAYKEAQKNKEIGVKHFEKYLQLLECKLENAAQTLDQFIIDDRLFGLEAAFEKLLFEVGIANSGWSRNLIMLSDMIQNIGNDSSKIAASFELLEDERISLDFYFGDSSPQVIIMTAHTSKGLQFPHVLIGGIHNNGRYISNNDFFGKLPGSFKWKMEQNQKTPFKSPHYLFESALERRKDFSESKRLFYVAATRAEDTLGFIDLGLSDGSAVYSDKNSWICGLRLACDELIGLPIQHSEVVFSVDELNTSDSAIDVPAFHQDTLGVTSVEGDHSSQLIFIPDLSVTGLSTLAQCPRKFYLSQVCKIQPEYLSNVPDQKNPSKVSSAERGTYLHEVLAQAIMHNFVINLSTLPELSSSDLESVNFALHYIKQTYDSEAQYSPEKVLKFSVFGHMISGTADLIIEGKSKAIIDFKTGKKPMNSDHYWFQLILYAFALGQLHHYADDDQIDLKLLYIDEKKIDRRTYSIGDVRTQVFNLWKKTTCLDKTELTHCASCTFGNLCLLNQGSVASY